MSASKAPHTTDPGPANTCTPAPPPSAAEIQRKLSCHAPTPPGHRRKGSLTKSPTIPSALSGTESDSDASATFSPPQRYASIDVGTTSTAIQPAGSNAVQAPPLEAIAEREGSGEDTDDEDDEWAAAEDQRQEAIDCENVVKAGYLQKKGERRKTWKKRWFVLRQTRLSYYKSNKEYQTLRVMPISDVHSASPVTLKRHDFTFGIVTPSRTYYVQAGSASEVDSWVRAINDVKAKVVITANNAPMANTEQKPKQIPPAINLQRTSSAAIDIHDRRTPPPTPGQPMQISASPSSPSYVPNYHLTSSDSEDHDQDEGPGSAICPGSSPNMGPMGSSPGTERQIHFAAPDLDPKKVILQGYLMKCGHQRKKWKKRWLVLTPERLIYAKSHLEVGNLAKPSRNVKIVPMNCVLDAIECTMHKRDGHGLGLVGGGIERSTSIGGSISMASAPTSGTSMLNSASFGGPLTLSHSPPALGHPATLAGGEASTVPLLPHTFRIITPKKPLVLCAPSEEEEIKWMSAVRALIARRASLTAENAAFSTVQQSQSTAQQQQPQGSPNKRASRRQGSFSGPDYALSPAVSSAGQQTIIPKTARTDSISKALSAVS